MAQAKSAVQHLEWRLLFCASTYNDTRYNKEDTLQHIAKTILTTLDEILSWEHIYFYNFDFLGNSIVNKFS